MRAFLQGVVYCWCKNRKDEWFAARDLLGGENYYWQGTPLMQLYTYYLNGNEENHDYAVEEAGKAAGRLLKEVLMHDKRTFATKEGYTLVQKKMLMSNSILTGVFLFYLFTLTVNSINLEALNDTLQAYLPGYYEDRIDGYVNEDEVESRLESASQNSWHVAFFYNLQYWNNQLLILFSFITIRKLKNCLTDILPLFVFALLICSFSNILACVPSGG